MERTVSFQSPGIIDLRCITTMGASVKEGENPIGFFGTGLKYALAIILRNGGTVNFYRGLERHIFTMKEVPIRGKYFHVVCMDGKELGFTTELGKTWQMWQAFREIYCNTVDEKGGMQLGTMQAAPGKTTIIVDCAEFFNCALNKHEFVLNAEPIYMHKDCEFHRHSSSNIFYRNIRVFDKMPKPFKYTPNLLALTPLTEDRTLQSAWACQSVIASAFNDCQDEAFVEDWLSVGDTFQEHTLDLFWSTGGPGPMVKAIGRKLYKDPMMEGKLNSSLRQYFRSEEGEPEQKEVVILPHESVILREAIRFCEELGYPVDEYRITVVETLGEGVLGRAHLKTQKIFLARTGLAQGKLQLAATMIEEWVHIKHRHQDCTRGLQNWLLENMIRLGAAYLHEKNSR